MEYYESNRALAAADNAVMLLDAAKGLEPQTRKLFEVVRMRSLPLCEWSPLPYFVRASGGPYYFASVSCGS